MHRTLLLGSTIALFAITGCPGPDIIDDDDAIGDDDDTDAQQDPWFCVEESWPATPDGPGHLVETPHYQLYAELDAAETETIARMLEGERAALADWWGATPDIADGELLAVELYTDEAAWADAIAADGLEVPWGAGGYYHPTTGIAYLYRQPTVWYTRVLTLHEALHQFHHRTRAAASVPGWFAEGHAEYMSLHDWDGDCLRLGRLPLLSLEDMPAQALAQAGSLDLAAHIAGDGSISRPLEWAMFRYFDRAEDGALAESWRDFRTAIDAGVTDREAQFEASFGAAPAEFEQPLRDWLANEQQPLEPAWLEWIHVDPARVEGFADVMSIAPLKDGADRFELRFEVPDEPSWWGGAMLSYDDSSNFVALLVGSDGSLSTFELHGGEVAWNGAGPAPSPEDGAYGLALEHGATETTVTINGQTATFPLDYTPAGGPALYEARIRFEGIAWE